MTALLIAGQDIRSLSLGLVLDGVLSRETTVEVPPEGYLSLVARTLAEWGLDIGSLEAVAVVVGPGSFTSSRVSTAIANGIAFARGIAVLAIENPERLPLRSLVERADFSSFLPVDRFAVPAYDRPPHIT